MELENSRGAVRGGVQGAGLAEEDKNPKVNKSDIYITMTVRSFPNGEMNRSESF